MNATEESQIKSALNRLVEQTPEPGPTPDDMFLRHPERSSSWAPLTAVAAATVAVVGLGFLVTNRDPGTDTATAPETQPVAAQPAPAGTSTTAPAPPQMDSPIWYDTIRPLLPDGFDQIVLTVASPEVVSFKAFRTDSRQLLDVTIVLQSGYGLKETGETATFSDEVGDYFESTSSAALLTRDQRLISVHCGLSPIGGGAVGGVGMADTTRDCGDGSDNPDLNTTGRRTLAARLATDFPIELVTPAFGQPEAPAAESDQVIELVNDFVGGTEYTFSTEQDDGVSRVANLSPANGEPSSTELTVVHGIWPPSGDGSAFDDSYTNDPQGRFRSNNDIAVALVVVNGTGYHIATTDVSVQHLTRLGELLNDLATTSLDNNQPPPVSNTEPAPDSMLPSTPSTTVSE